ncbi:MAG: hypothetical protein CMG66_02515 [Candidatus Marinimicrobia bacterium]|nr:hypothetical protein [Candidatus Neomarinimicrobiota bacterium]|tara:strand:+ start:19751 stop:21604 length:1854 start_codon:yes stop_codon:yes gene_type:complete
MAIFLYILFISIVYPVSVTFNVDMQEEYLSGGNVYLAGADSLSESFFGFNIDSTMINPWSPNDMQLFDDNFSGVFSGTILLEPNTIYSYKFVNGTNYELEGEVNRTIYVQEQDTVLNVSCFNLINETCEQIDNILIPVTFTVDMQQVDISENGVGLLGANDSFTNFGYDLENESPIPVYDAEYLSLQEDSDNNGVYSVTLLLEPGIDYQYKFINGNDFSGVEQLQRTISVSPVSGYYLNEVCFDSYDDCEEFTSLLTSLSFKTNVSNAIAENGFELGDMLIVKWGYGQTQPVEKIDTLQLLPFSYDYVVDIDSVYVSEEVGLYYQYYKIIDDIEYREVFFNFDYSNEDIVLAERRFFDFNNSLNSQILEIEDIVDSNIDSRRMPFFENTNSIGEDLDVRWTIDLSPAYYQILSGDTLFDIQGSYHVDNVDSLYRWGVWMNGPASSPANGEIWTQWGSALQGTTSKKMWDDGTHGDVVANDHIYTLILTYDENSSISQECKFGIKGGDNESSYGLNHYENINSSDPNIHIYWGSINPVFYNSWDYDINEPILNLCESDGDVNQDGVINVVDVISTVNLILLSDAIGENELCTHDINLDGVVNVVDIIALVNTILGINL